ncbi:MULTISPECIES: thioredoxin family protein [Mesobacillus]|uniref:thioredoxin family protein n=1 Tax=Mesobacillus TaxID=2675231 RepID=UPI00177F3D6E|nr:MULTISPECIES: thioredoxin family protein [Mesobacillus]MCM3574774.1 thioredoxin family protein [Mesobacillus subterraneus]UYZ21433.1 thioredoxin family protein [Mesobacillus jeotgali]
MEEWTKSEMDTFLEEKRTGYLYFYTPMCGTCQVAGKMLTVIDQLLPEIPSGKADLNYLPEMAERFEIESVPCLIMLNKGEVLEKIYAFQSVPYLYEKLKGLN